MVQGLLPFCTKLTVLSRSETSYFSLSHRPAGTPKQDDGHQGGRGRRGALRVPPRHACPGEGPTGAVHPRTPAPGPPRLSSAPCLGGAWPPSCPTTDGGRPRPGEAARAARLPQQLRLPPLRLHHPLRQGLPTGWGGPGWASAFPAEPRGGGRRAEGRPGTRGRGRPWAGRHQRQGAGGGELWCGEARRAPSRYVWPRPGTSVSLGMGDHRAEPPPCPPLRAGRSLPAAGVLLGSSLSTRLCTLGGEGGTTGFFNVPGTAGLGI